MISRVFLVRWCALAAVAVIVAGSARATDYNEFVAGDMSSDPRSPTPLALTPGSNLLVAQSSDMDIDLLRVSVPASHTLDSITVQSHDGTILVFAGVEAGSVWTAGTGLGIDPSQMLGWVDFPTDVHTVHTGEDILDDMGLAAGSQGFTPPLVGGVYTFLFQTYTSAVPFAISFDVSGDMTLLPGDFNADSAVNGADLTVWRNSFGKTAGADANGDGRSDGFDALVWQLNQGTSGSVVAAAAVPEPATAMLAAGSIFMFGAAGRRMICARREKVFNALDIE